MKYIISAVACAALSNILPNAFAQEVVQEKEGWKGEGALSAGMTSGNTDTSDIGLNFDVDRVSSNWDFGVQGQVDYGKQDGAESRNRVFLGTNLDYDVTERVFSFARASYEVDQFTGFDSRSFVGGGLGYRFFDNEKISWIVRGGPGVKIDEVKRVITTDENGAALIIPADTVNSVGAVGKSKFELALNDKVGISNITDVIYAEESTQISNGLALTAQINGSLSARFGFDTRYDTNPPIGFESTDTATKIGVVYKFGAH
ncbi:MAG: DUF481 domain-containing protein [Hyphomonas sp.]|nr:DUF481 domain-containing protein [Hyphomonas sp.]HRX72640.1 DUF481 domain-containing protein [Hyphomonas sp.]